MHGLSETLLQLSHTLRSGAQPLLKVLERRGHGDGLHVRRLSQQGGSALRASTEKRRGELTMRIIHHCWCWGSLHAS